MIEIKNKDYVFFGKACPKCGESHFFESARDSSGGSIKTLYACDNCEADITIGPHPGYYWAKCVGVKKILQNTNIKRRPIGILNFLILQFFFIRIARVGECDTDSGVFFQTGWKLLKWIWPLTGW